MRASFVIMFGTVFFAALFTGQAAEADHNGQWWREQSAAEKTRYAARLFDGMTVGSNLLEFGLSAQVVVKPAASHRTTAGQQYVRFDGGQLSDYIDKFYTDPRNSTITVARASQVFLQSVAGTPRVDLQRMIEDYRKPGC